MNERKMKILEAVISDYIVSAEPIGSRTIAKKYDFGLSSATIRNEMSDLEEMGYVVALHASSGRVPSNKGYRLYVDNVMKKRRLSASERELLTQALQNESGKMDNIMREIAQAVSHITNYTIIATEPLAKSHKIRQIQLI
ncbi:MAG: HrcA family transcriptional regulator, partial [Defluviitaleaceae bacterium]|nr:HrcA family transcriptional regulator [Defluviitaleaceae bacterium]